MLKMCWSSYLYQTDINKQFNIYINDNEKIQFIRYTAYFLSSAYHFSFDDQSSTPTFMDKKQGIV